MGRQSLAFSGMWLAFTVLFLALGSWHWNESEKRIPPFEIGKRPAEGKGIEMEFLGLPLDKPLKDFVRSFNTYLDRQNESARIANRRAALGYFAAALTALLSMVLGLMQHRPKPWPPIALPSEPVQPIGDNKQNKNDGDCQVRHDLSPTK
ncbi:MAG: hypothetical protein V1694_03050 [Candidatus Eisenbacteria bacterium]